MTGIERRQFEMLVRVRSFGQAHAALFATPVAQETLAAVSKAIDDLTVADMGKVSAAAAARANRRAVARRALMDLLRNMNRLARNLSAEGTDVPRLAPMASRSDQALLTMGRLYAEESVAFEAMFSGHGMSPARIAAVTAAFEAAIREQSNSRSNHVASAARIHGLLGAAIRGARRLDLIIDNHLDHENELGAEWKQLRRIEPARGPRTAGPPVTPAAGQGRLAPTAPDRASPTVAPAA
jgi:hypothetical protein